MDDEQEALLKEQPAEGDGKGGRRKCGAAMLRQLAATGCLAGVIISWVAMAETLQSLNREYKKPYLLVYWVHSYYALMYVVWKIWRIFPGGFSFNQVGDGAFTGSEKRFIILSGVVAVVQQIATYVWYLSLPRTNIPANMAIYQVTPAVVFILSVPLLRERVTLLKVVSVLLSIGGAGLVSYYSYHDQCSSDSGGGDNSTSLAFIERWSASPNSSCDPSVEKSTPLGYVYLVGGMVLYALQSTLVKKLVTRKGDPAAVPNAIRFIGYTGVYTMLFMWPVIIILHYTKLEVFELPSLKLFGLMFANVALELVFTNSYITCIALSSPLFATVGSVLNIPASVITDWIIQQFTLPPLAYVGIVSILIGFSGFTFAAFVAARREGKEESKTDKRAPTTYSSVQETKSKKTRDSKSLFYQHNKSVTAEEPTGFAEISQKMQGGGKEDGERTFWDRVWPYLV